MTRYSHLLETRNRFANDDLWQDVLAVLVLACAGSGRRHADCGGGMTRLLLLAAALVAVLAAAGVGAGAEWHVYQGVGTPIRGRD